MAINAMLANLEEIFQKGDRMVIDNPLIGHEDRKLPRKWIEEKIAV